MRLIKHLLLVISICSVSGPTWAQSAPSAQPRASGGSPAVSTVPEASGETKAVTQAILEEIDKRSELMANIEYLCDMIGPRLTGSPNLTKANEWTRDKFKQYGLSNSHLEPWTITRGWTRGDARGRVVVPVEQRSLSSQQAGAPRPKGPCVAR